MKESCLSKNVLWYGGLFIVISIISLLLDRLLPYPIFVMKDGIVETLLISGGILVFQKNNFDEEKMNFGKAIVGSILGIMLFYILETIIFFVFQFIFNILPSSVIIIIVGNMITTLLAYFVWFFIYIALCKIIFKLDNPYVNLKKNIIISLIILIILSLVGGIRDTISQIMALQMLESKNGMLSLVRAIEMGSRWGLTYLIILVKTVVMAILSVGLIKQENADLVENNI